MSRLGLTRAVYEAIRAHGEETFPHECCGELLGRFVDGEWAVEDAVRVLSLASGSSGAVVADGFCGGALDWVRLCDHSGEPGQGYGNELVSAGGDY